jgi:hypothetical protein
VERSGADDHDVGPAGEASQHPLRPADVELVFSGRRPTRHDRQRVRHGLERVGQVLPARRQLVGEARAVVQTEDAGDGSLGRIGVDDDDLAAPPRGDRAEVGRHLTGRG